MSRKCNDCCHRLLTNDCWKCCRIIWTKVRVTSTVNWSLVSMIKIKSGATTRMLRRGRTRKWRNFPIIACCHRKSSGMTRPYSVWRAWPSMAVEFSIRRCLMLKRCSSYSRLSEKTAKSLWLPHLIGVNLWQKWGTSSGLTLNPLSQIQILPPEFRHRRIRPWKKIS